MDKDKKIADSNWGIKPDDQPANAADAPPDAAKIYRYDPADPDVIRSILKAQRRGFNTANAVRIEPNRTIVIDINKDEFAIEGLSYGDDNLIDLLNALGATFDPVQLRQCPRGDTQIREFPLSRAWAWGAERASG